MKEEAIVSVMSPCSITNLSWRGASCIEVILLCSLSEVVLRVLQACCLPSTPCVCSHCTASCLSWWRWPAPPQSTSPCWQPTSSASSVASFSSTTQWVCGTHSCLQSLDALKGFWCARVLNDQVLITLALYQKTNRAKKHKNPLISLLLVHSFQPFTSSRLSSSLWVLSCSTPFQRILL